MTKYNNCEEEYVCCLPGSYGYDKEIEPVSVFNDFQIMRFEDRKYYGIKNASIYLNKVYGDSFMTPPPESKRKTHEFEYIDFGEYRNLF